jgi:hypothetical protein
MRIPNSQILAASASALPQQAARVASPTSNNNAVNSASTAVQKTEKLSESTQTGDRDAQEQYLGQNPKDEKGDKASPTEADPLESPVASIWNLAVDDDFPPSDLDIRG